MRLLRAEVSATRAAAAHAGEWVERRLQRWLVVGTLFVGFTLTLYLMLWA